MQDQDDKIETKKSEMDDGLSLKRILLEKLGNPTSRWQDYADARGAPQKNPSDNAPER